MNGTNYSQRSSSERSEISGRGLLLSFNRSGIARHDASHEILDGQKTIGVVFGLVSRTEAVWLVDQLRRGDDPGRTAPDAPWIATAARSDGSIAATASTMLYSGLFYAIEQSRNGPRIILASDPGSILSLKEDPTELNAKFILEFAGIHAGDSDTPYLGMARVPPGRTVIWSPTRNPGRPSIAYWLDPGEWEDPDLEGRSAITEYRTTFDNVIEDLVGRVGPISTELSGGLDSSFLAASLLKQTTPTKPMLALTHRPHPNARLLPEGSWDPDDSQFAAVLTDLHPDRIEHQFLVNHALIQPLDAAARAAKSAWWPTLNPGNQVWLSESARRAGARGSNGVFTGQGGNATFSARHAYAVSPPVLQSGLRSTVRAIARTVEPARLNRWRNNQLVRKSFHMVGLRTTPPSADNTRDEWLDFMTGMEGTAPMAAANPAADRTYRIDPFRSRAIIELAGRITPATWLNGPYDRGFARLVGEDRVPDEIRLRTRRGAQAWDSWFVIHDQRDRYLESVDQLAKIPLFDRIVDSKQLRRQVLALPWGDPDGRGSWNLFAIDRVLSLGDFVQMTHARLKRMNDRNQRN